MRSWSTCRPWRCGWTRSPRSPTGWRACARCSETAPRSCSLCPGRSRSAIPAATGAPEGLDEVAAGLLEAVNQLGPAHADCLAVVERTRVGGDDAPLLDEALAPLWNIARHYATASLLVAAEGGIELADTGADAVTVWSGISPEELAAGGARHVGWPIDPSSPAPVLRETPPGGFYTLRGELPAETEIDWLRQLVAAVGR